MFVVSRGRAVGATACRVYNNANISHTSSGTAQVLTFNTDRKDDRAMHFTSASNLTGTVSKTASSATLTGSSTLFLSELSVGQIIDVPGTATERRVVTAIASNTSLTVSGTFANTASGQTAARVNTGIVAVIAGWYHVWASVIFAANATGRRNLALRVNGVDSIATQMVQAVSEASVTTNLDTSTHYYFNQWDYVEVVVNQASGGALDVVASSPVSPEFGMTWLGA